MPFDDHAKEPGIGLALSGGGFRATLFHLGSLWRLNELGYLKKLDRISSVSGGSITSGLLAVNWEKLQWNGEIASNFNEQVVAPLRSFCARNIDGPAIAEGALIPWRSISDEVQERYEDHLLGTGDLQSLPGKPRFVFNSTNFATGVDFRFSKPYAGDYRIGLINEPKFRVSLAVTASSAFPPVLSPVTIKTDPNSFQRVDGADLYDQTDYRRRLVLTDGGVYDNMGLETVWNRYETVLVSDAGAPFGLDAHVETNWLKQAMRALDVATNQSRALRKRAIVADYKKGERKGAYWGIATHIADYQLADALPCSEAMRKEQSTIRTRLNSFSESEQCKLINWGYTVCDAGMRKHVIQGPAAAPKLPYPNYPLG